MRRLSRLAVLSLATGPVVVQALPLGQACRELLANVLAGPQRLFQDIERERRQLALADLERSQNRVRALGRNPVPATLQQRLLRQMRRYLEIEGYRVEARGSSRGQTRLILHAPVPPRNSLQKTMHVLNEKFGVQVVYDPSVGGSVSGAFDPAENVVLVSPGALLEHNFGTVVHETAHAATFRNLQARRPSPFYGMATHVGSPLPDSSGYRDFLAFDEMKSHWIEANHYRTASHKSGAGRVSRIMAPMTASQGLDLSTAILLLVHDAQEQLERGLRPVFKRDELGIAAIFTLHAENTLPTELRIPLVQSQGVSDPANLELVEKQLRSTEQEARKKIKEFKDFLRAYKGVDF